MEILLALFLIERVCAVPRATILNNHLSLSARSIIPLGNTQGRTGLYMASVLGIVR